MICWELKSVFTMLSFFIFYSSTSMAARARHVLASRNIAIKVIIRVYL